MSFGFAAAEAAQWDAAPPAEAANAGDWAQAADPSATAGDWAAADAPAEGKKEGETAEAPKAANGEWGEPAQDFGANY